MNDDKVGIDPPAGDVHRNSLTSVPTTMRHSFSSNPLMDDIELGMMALGIQDDLDDSGDSHVDIWHPRYGLLRVKGSRSRITMILILSQMLDLNQIDTARMRHLHFLRNCFLHMKAIAPPKDLQRPAKLSSGLENHNIMIMTRMALHYSAVSV